MKDKGSRAKMSKNLRKTKVFERFKGPRESDMQSRPRRGRTPGGTFLEGFMSGSSTVPAAPRGVRPD